jgi:hypothetical protein
VKLHLICSNTTAVVLGRFSHKKKYPYQKKCDMFLPFFGVIVGSRNAIGRIFISMA